VAQTKKIEPTWKAPRIAPRAYETAEIVEILESPKFSSDKQMATAVMAAALKLMAQRDWFVIANRVDDMTGAPVVLWGFFATEDAALKALATNSLGLMGVAGVYEVKSLTQRSDYLDAEDAALAKGCAECGHTEAGHDWPKSKVRGCVVAGCACMTYVRPRRDVPALELS